MVFLNATLVSLDLILGNKLGKQSTCVKTVQAKAFCLFVLSLLFLLSVHRIAGSLPVGHTVVLLRPQSSKPTVFTLTHTCPENLFNTKHPDAKKKKKKKPSRLCKRWLPPKTNRRKYSTISSLNKGSPSSEVHVSRMPELHSAKTH